MKKNNTRATWGMVLLATAFAAFAGPAAGDTEAVIDLGGDNPLVMVKTPDGLWFGKYEITQRQWKSVMGANPVERAIDEGSEKPVAGVDFEDVQAFLGRLNAMDAVKNAGFSFRLPTADEWTAACLAGSRGPWPRGADGREGSLESMAWYRTTPRTSRDKADPLRPVGGKAPNAYGLYDMLGNAEEMTATTQAIHDVFRGNVLGHVFCGGGVNCRPEPEPIRNDFTGQVDDSGQNFRDAARTRLASAARRDHGGFRVCSSTGRATGAGGTDGSGAVAAGSDAGAARPAPAAPTESAARSVSAPAAARPVASSAEPPSDEQLLAIARQKADGFAAQGDFERADRIMEQAQRYIENRRTGGGQSRSDAQEDSIPGEIPASLKDLYGRAVRGDPEAQFSLGREYSGGENVPKNRKEAAAWWRKAAEQGHVLAQSGLGLLYYGGTDVPKDPAEAVKWFRKAAEQGDSTSQYFLGMMVFNGVGTPANGAEAVRLLQAAADQGHAGAKEMLPVLLGLSSLDKELLGPNCAERLKKVYGIVMELPSVK